MKCARAVALIETLHFGEPVGAETEPLAEHLGVCAACRAVRAELERETAFFEAYGERQQITLHPGAEAWREVERRIGAAGDRPRLGALRHAPLAWAAGIAAAVGLAALSLTLYRNPGAEREVSRGALTAQPPTAARPGPAPAVAPPVSAAVGTFSPETGRSAPASTPVTSPKPAVGSRAVHARAERAVRPTDSIRRAEREYLHAITLLDATLAERRAALGPVLGQALESTMLTVDRAIAESRRVYLAHPHDFELAEYLLAAYARKVEVLQALGS